MTKVSRRTRKESSRQHSLPIPRPSIATYQSRPCAILWIDILGFRNLLEGVERGDRRARIRIGQLEAFLDKEIFKEAFPWKFDTQLFSDTLVITFPFPRSGEAAVNLHYQLPFYIGLLQCKFLSAGFPIRGAVGAGRWIRTQRLKSSPLYASLHRNESEEAVVPRILYGLGEEREDIAETHFNSATTAGLPGFDAAIATATDFDGRIFIDYLACCATGYWSDDRFLIQHKRLIEEGIALGRTNTSVLGKYYWMARYHNRVVGSDCFTELFTDCVENDETLSIDLSLFPKKLRMPIPGVSKRLSYYFNWDRPNIYRPTSQQRTKRGLTPSSGKRR